VVLTSHRGRARVAGPTIPAADLKAMLDALDANDWLARIDAVLTGYMPSMDHAAAAMVAVARVKEAQPKAIALCDPACGDAPKGLYVQEEAAGAIKDWLLPVCDVARLNAFELAWATGRSVTNRGEALAAARALGPQTVLATSVPAEDEASLLNLLVVGGDAWVTSVPAREQVPHGAGDFLSGLFLAHLLKGALPQEALGLATAALQMAIVASDGHDELRLVGTEADWVEAAPWPVERIGS
jgi:pyridoxine kinase